MKKSDREIIFNKFNGKCYLCGDQLKPGWHADHLIPCRRKWKSVRDENGRHKLVPNGFDNPEANCIENMMPACASCNINKHSSDLETFRSLIHGFMKHLNEVSTQYKIAKRYGLVHEDIKPVVFYFENVQAIQQNALILK